MIKERVSEILNELPSSVRLVAVSKFHPVESMMEAYDAGQRVFGENRPQELASKVPDMPKDVEWHFIGHLQTNKLKMVLPYATLIQSVDSIHLLTAINDWGRSNGKTISVLLELHIGAEQTKQGFVEEEVLDILFRADSFSNIRFCGLMGMATHSECEDDVRADFCRISSYMDYLKDLFPELTDFTELSIGMSSDWRIALEFGATMVRIGSSIFGPRQ